MINSRDKDSIVKVITAFHPEAKLYLFGSYARGTQHVGSDIDLAIDAGRELELREQGLLRGLLSALPIGPKIDLVDVHGDAVSEAFRKSVFRDAIVWKE